MAPHTCSSRAEHVVKCTRSCSALLHVYGRDSRTDIAYVVKIRFSQSSSTVKAI